MDSVELELVRGVYLDATAHVPGERVRVSTGLAAELISAGKARIAPPQERPRRKPAAPAVLADPAPEQPDLIAYPTPLTDSET